VGDANGGLLEGCSEAILGLLKCGLCLADGLVGDQELLVLRR
jgi:hypothetical protein